MRLITMRQLNQIRVMSHEDTACQKGRSLNVTADLGVGGIHQLDGPHGGAALFGKLLVPTVPEGLEALHHEL